MFSCTKCVALVTFSALYLPSIISGVNNLDEATFPEGFLFGAATSAYQIEGAWNISGKGESVWDRYTHAGPYKIDDGQNGDVACDSYHKFKEDIKLIKEAGLNSYRFSLSWTRILPTGYSNNVSQDGIKYYHAILDELERNDITPLVTIYHWDHPQLFQDFGGWTNEVMVELFADYARVVFEEFGGRVKIFSTINEPDILCYHSLNTGIHAPGLNLGKHGEYLCSANTLKAHARAYHIYDQEFRHRQKGQIGIVVQCPHFYPKYQNDPDADDLVEVGFQYFCGRYTAPIFSRTGDFPRRIKDMIGNNSQVEGLARSRLPVLTQYWIDYIKGSSDYLGLNHYTSLLVEAAPKPINSLFNEDHGLSFDKDPKWPRTPADFMDVVPQGIKDVLIKMKQEYGDVPVYIMENGVPDRGTLLDSQRLEYLYSYMKSTLSAIKDHNCNVKSYTVWSLLDNFEWKYGYGLKFGLFNVDFNHPNRTRTPKTSVAWLKSVIRTRKLQPIAPYLSSGKCKSPKSDFTSKSWSPESRESVFQPKNLPTLTCQTQKSEL